MAEDFDPSPRSTKRRKTTYGAGRSILGNKQNENSTQPTSPPDVTRKSARNSSHSDNFDDSAYDPEHDGLRSEKCNDLLTDTTGRTPQPASKSRMTGLRTSERTRRARDSSDGQVAHVDHDQGLTNGIGPNTEDVPEVPEFLTRDTPPLKPAEPGDDQTNANVVAQPRSSGRERKRPRRFSVSPGKSRSQKGISADEPKQKRAKETTKEKINGSIADSPLKGILTPSRRGKPRLGPRKSVVFEQNEEAIGEQLGFKDIESSTGKRTALIESSSKDVEIISDGEDAPATPTKGVSRKKKTPAKDGSKLDVWPESEPESDHMLADILAQTRQLEPAIAPQMGSPANRTILEDDEHILAIKSTILSRLVSGGTKLIPSHLQAQYGTIHALLRATVTTGESNSLLLLGARGAGKSHLLEMVVSDLATKHMEDFHTVRLNGFFQTDDRVALREIWRQLGREMQVSEMETGELGGSYADTMTSLLSLLSHPDEFADLGASDDGAMHLESGPIRTSKSIVFILDEFDLFTTHPRQTLLYNLFDIAQSKKAPIAVIGCSTRMDVVECLEKRVKSRFSHRWLHVPFARTLSGFEDMVKDVLQMKEQQGAAAIQVSATDLATRKRWDDYIQSSFMPSAQIQDLVKRTFYTTKSLPEVLTALYTPVATIVLPEQASDGHSQQPGPTFRVAANSPSSLALLMDLPTLHLSLVVAAARLDTIHNLTTMNFNLVYAHYVELIARSKLQITASGAVAVGALLRQWNRETAKSAWEDLGLCDLIVPVVGAGAGANSGLGSKDGASTSDSIGGEGASVRMWRLDVTLEDAAWAVKEKWKESGGVKDVLARWCREI